MENSTKKTILITGATSGLGLAALNGLLQEGHRLIGVARSLEKIEAAEDAIHQKFPHAEVKFLKADLSSQAQIHTLADQVASTLDDWGLDHLDVLVNNAGAVTSWYTLTEDGYEHQFAINHLAPFCSLTCSYPTCNEHPKAESLQSARCPTVTPASTGMT